MKQLLSCGYEYNFLSKVLNLVDNLKREREVYLFLLKIKTKLYFVYNFI